MISSIDHVVILVEDLDEGIRQYRDLGFTVTPGGKHPRFTHNALVSFEDGSYLELIAFWETAGEQDIEMHRWQKHLEHHGGLIDYAVAVKPLEDDLAAIGQRGIGVSGPHPGARSRLDGVQVAWKMGQVTEKNPGSLPFMIEDITDRAVRVPGGDTTRHANGVRGIVSLGIVTGDPAAAARRYAALLGASPDARTFQIGPQQVELVPASSSAAAAAQHAERGDSLFQLTFAGNTPAEFDPRAAGNARLRIVTG